MHKHALELRSLVQYPSNRWHPKISCDRTAPQKVAMRNPRSGAGVVNLGSHV